MPLAGASPNKKKPFDSNGQVFLYYPLRFLPYPVRFFDLKPQSIQLITRKKYLSKVRVNQIKVDTLLAFINGIELGGKPINILWETFYTPTRSGYYPKYVNADINFDIIILDHLIVSEKHYFSFKDENFI